MFVRHTGGKRGSLLRALVGALGGVLLLGGQAWAAAPVPSDFNLQITPSPLVTTVKPGVRSQLELKIRNGGSGSEDLKIEPKAFRYNSATGQVSLDNTAVVPVASWISFSAAKFSVQPGQWFSEEISLNTPKDAGFSYSFALVISRQANPTPIAGQRLLKGSVAVFTLVNVDRPGAVSQLKVVDFSSSKHLYEYLPATLTIRFKNTGNTIAQPYGNIFVQRGASAKTPLATLPVNASKGYILPGTERTISTQWNDGFAIYQTVPQPDGNTKKHLSIDWSKLSHFRIGRYTARLVAVYSDGQHDVPIEGTVTFWVVPWQAILLFIVVVIGLWLLARWRGKRRTAKAVRRALAAQEATHKAKERAKEEASKATNEEKQP
ncbi:MAG TPA: hypothetical protein VLF69_05115 [Candidatus Saccharimonadales bacterium]|nr:hypothetical protein [Candidatus Saccharimonadales bacterium]